jgi:outer membrane receptor protein involved in Fe transport
LVAEGGRQSWEYEPDPNFLDGGAYLYTAVAGAGHRTRYAGTGELRLPVLEQVTIDLSGRYDDYKYDGGSFNKFTYNAGLEYRPVKTLLVRGRYGTAFKAPTLSDQYQGQSGFFTGSANDYYWCDTHGFKGNYQACPQGGQSFFGTTEGNPNLKPINATVWDAGFVWSPVERSQFGVDYLHWHINDEVAQQDTDQLLRTESACLQGQLDPTTPTCVAAISQVHRDPVTDLIDQIDTPKQNLSEENLDVLLFTLNYGWNMGAYGNMVFESSYTHVLKHNFVRFPGDPQINYLTSPFYSTEFQDKANAALTWNYEKFSTTVYGEYYGNTPNNQATLDVSGYAQPNAGKLGAWVIANWSASYEVLSGLTVTANVNNVFNKMPPFDPTWTGLDNQPFNIFNYNNYGREYFVGASYKFGK